MNFDNEKENANNVVNKVESTEAKQIAQEVKPDVDKTAEYAEKSAETVEQSKSTKTNKKQNPILKAISLATKIILWSLIVITLSLLLITVASRKTDILGYRLYIIMSGSMEPTIHVKDAIITKQIDEPQNGDIIAFENGDMITVHRIIKVYTEGDNRLYQTKGDNNNADDPGLVQKTQVKGKVKVVLPFVGRTVLFLQSHFIVLILAIGIITIIIIARRLI